jgi:hypothetical protein
MNLGPVLVTRESASRRGIARGHDIRLVHVALLGVDEGLDMAAVAGLSIERRAGLRPCIAVGLTVSGCSPAVSHGQQQKGPREGRGRTHVAVGFAAAVVD